MPEITLNLDSSNIPQFKEWEDRILKLEKEVETLKNAEILLPEPPEQEEEFAKYQWGLQFSAVRGYLTNIDSHLTLLREDEKIKDKYHLEKAMFFLEKAKSSLKELKK